MSFLKRFAEPYGTETELSAAKELRDAHGRQEEVPVHGKGQSGGTPSGQEDWQEGAEDALRRGGEVV